MLPSGQHSTLRPNCTASFVRCDMLGAGPELHDQTLKPCLVFFLTIEIVCSILIRFLTTLSLSANVEISHSFIFPCSESKKVTPKMIFIHRIGSQKPKKEYRGRPCLMKIAFGSYIH